MILVKTENIEYSFRWLKKEKIKRAVLGEEAFEALFLFKKSEYTSCGSETLLFPYFISSFLCQCSETYILS